VHPGTTSVLIPRIFHQIWVGTERFPEEYTRHQESWLHHHPDWELRFWTEKNLPAPEELRRREASELLRSPWERSDVFRLEVIWRFGGVYVDADFECLRSIEPLIEDADFFIGLANSRCVNNALFGAVAGHAALDQALEEVRPREFPGYDKAATGARFLERVLSSQSGVTFFDREVFYPRTPDEIEKAYAVHGERAWDTVDGLWQSLLMREKRLKAAQKEAHKWRAKYEEVEAKLLVRESLQPVPPDNVHPATTSLRIPRTFHQIWLGPDPFPEEYAAYQATWLRHHPGWALRFWTEENLPEELRRPEVAERLRNPTDRSNILRLELIWRFGGVYVDTDVECLRSIDPLIEDTDFFITLRHSGGRSTNNFFFGAVAGHPILDRGLDEIRPRQKFGATNKGRTGVRFMNELIAGHRNKILLLEPAKLKGYAVHHRHRTYLGSEALRPEMLRAKREMQAAQDEIRTWRARSKETEAEPWKQG
jgi:inositol phosphorylceramide mannosyltransferase catalytic subunit